MSREARGEGAYSVHEDRVDLFLFEVAHKTLTLEEGEGAAEVDEEELAQMCDERTGSHGRGVVYGYLERSARLGHGGRPKRRGNGRRLDGVIYAS